MTSAEFLTLIIQWLSKVPDVVWSGVIGALVAASISLLSVRSTNKGSSERLRAQHAFDVEEAIKQHQYDVAEANAQREHDAKQKAEDRKAAIRREVYTAAVEATHRLLAHFGSLPDLPVGAGKEMGPFQDFLAANSKIWLVAEAEASHMSRELANLVGEAFFVLLPAAQPLRSVLAPLRGLQEQIASAQTELARIQTRLSEAVEKGEEDSVVERLRHSFDRNEEWRMELDRRVINLSASVRDQRYAFITSSMDTLAPIQKTLVRLVSSLRAELDLDSDLNIFMSQYEDQSIRMRTAVDQAYNGR